MRLLNVNSKKFQEFTKNIPPFIATSHRWSENETTYQDVRDKRNSESAGYSKVEDFCEIARRSNNKRQTEGSDLTCDWIWIDTCCIDKTSSAEVTEAINSMFSWYKNAHHCIAYLADVRPFSAGLGAVMSDFRRSEWFERGWTLQELLAPNCVIFMNQTWEIIGHKCSKQQTCAGCAESRNAVLNPELAEITSIPEDVLCNYENSKALRPKTKWSWTSHRKTTKPEDTAYCLLGLFDVYMPLIYGEGARNASERLKQEIRKRNKARAEKQRFGWQNEWSPLSGKPLFMSPKMKPRPEFFHGEDETQAGSTASEFASAQLHFNDKARRRRSVQRPAACSNFAPVNRAELSAAQIATAGIYLSELDLHNLSLMTPSQIAAAEEFLPYWDLSVLARMEPGKIAAAVHARRSENDNRHTGVT